MTVHYADPELEVNIPLATVDVDGGEKATLHAIHSLPNTVEADIAATAARLTTIIASLATLDSRVDGLEALGTALNGFVDGLEGLQTTLAGYVDGLETALGAGAAQDRTTAAAPSATRLSTGAAFYDAAKTGQLPTALGATTKALSLSVAHATDDPSITEYISPSAIALGALNAVASGTSLSGRRSAAFVIYTGGNLVGTLVPEAFVGGWQPTVFVDPLTGASSPSLVVSSPGDMVRGILLLPGAVNVRVRVSAWTSGSSSTAIAIGNADPTLGLLLSLQTLLAPATPYIEQITAIPAVGGTASQFTSQTLVKGMTIRNCSTGGQVLYITKSATTPTATNSYVLAPGESTMPLDCTNANAWKILGSASGGAACMTAS